MPSQDSPEQLRAIAAVPLRVLILNVETRVAVRVVATLDGQGHQIVSRSVTGSAGLERALENAGWDAVVVGCSDPRLQLDAGISLVRRVFSDDALVIALVPERENALGADAVRRGAADYVCEDDLARLPLVVERETRNAARWRDASVATQVALHAKDFLYRYRHVGSPGFEYVSPSCQSLTGFSAEEFHASPDLLARIIHAEDLPFFDAAHRGPVSLSGALLLRITRRDGKEAWIEQTLVRFFLPDGTLAATEGVWRDVTRRIRLEQAFHDNEQRLVLVLESMVEPLFVLAGGGRIRETNRAAQVALGRTADELARMPFSSLVATGADTLPAELARFLLGEPVTDVPLRLACAGADTIPVLLTARPVTSARRKDQDILVMARDARPALAMNEALARVTAERDRAALELERIRLDLHACRARLERAVDTGGGGR